MGLYTAGVDLGGSKITVGLVDAQGLSAGRLSVATDSSGGGEGIARQIAQAVFSLCRTAGIAASELCGVGVATPGWVEAPTGVVLSSANLPLGRFPLAARIAALTGLAVRVENDANCAALGELIYGAAKGRREVLLLTVGTGLGAGVIREGRLMAGPGVAELGHTVLVLDGALCGCGRNGCCEAYCSAAALSRMAGERARQRGMSPDRFADAKSVFEAAAAGDESASAALEHYLSCFAEMLMNFVNIFRPELVLIGGGVSQAGEAFFTPLRQKFGRIARANVYGVNPPDILAAEHKNDAGILGATALFFDCDTTGGREP
jgi:glucokinase-like ROK family protein